MNLPQSPTAQVGLNVRAEMARARLSQKALASHLSLSQTAVSKRLAGVVPFDVNELAVIADVLSVDVGRLLDGAMVSADVSAA